MQALAGAGSHGTTRHIILLLGASSTKFDQRARVERTGM
jgi:hypothetical protein